MLEFLMKNLPLTFGAIFVGGIALLVFIPMLISYWRLAHCSLLAIHEVYRDNHIATKPVEAAGIFVGMVSINLALYLFTLVTAALPSRVLFYILAGLDLICLLFILDYLLVTLIVKSRIRVLERRLHRIN